MEQLGNGGNWKVFKLADPQWVFRIPKGSADFLIREFLKNHVLTKNLGLPTLTRVENHCIDRIEGILCENLNFGEELIFISPNSLYSDNNKEADDLTEAITNKTVERRISQAEQYRYRNKLEEIIDFDGFLENIITDLELAASKQVLIEYDTYFVGTEKHAIKSKLNYILADLDHVYYLPDRTESNILVDNKTDFSTAMLAFLEHFVTDKHRPVYIEALNKFNTKNTSIKG